MEGTHKGHWLFLYSKSILVRILSRNILGEKRAYCQTFFHRHEIPAKNYSFLRRKRPRWTINSVKGRVTKLAGQVKL